jgi:group I intron endonuclease
MSTRIYHNKTAKIYIAINLCSETLKSYVGVTIQELHARKRRHKWESVDSIWYFHRAIQKYGWRNFYWDVLAETNDEEYARNELEPYYIRECKSHSTENGYNMTLGGGGIVGCSEESRLKISKAHLGKRFSEERKTNISKALKNRKFSKTHRKNLSKANYGKHLSEEHKRNIGNAGKGLKRSEETKTKMSLSNARKKTWIIATPNGIIKTEFLPTFCKEHDIKYSSFLSTFHRQQNSKLPYKIIKRID